MYKDHLNAQVPCLLRSYSIIGNEGPNCTIWEALCATTADPNIFKSISIHDSSTSTSFVGGDMGYSNPISKVLEEAALQFPGRHVACIVSIGAGHSRIINFPEGGGSGWHRIPDKVLKTMGRIATDAEREAEEMERRCSHMPDLYFQFNVKQGLQDISPSNWGWSNSSRISASTMAYLQTPEVDGSINRAVRGVQRRKRLIPTTHISSYYISTLIIALTF
jgi:hypothetical protein